MALFHLAHAMTRENTHFDAIVAEPVIHAAIVARRISRGVYHRRNQEIASVQDAVIVVSSTVAMMDGVKCLDYGAAIMAGATRMTRRGVFGRAYTQALAKLI